jgi:hypothetical protein
MDKKIYERPKVLFNQVIRFETAHSWNKGIGNKTPGSNGNGGIYYPIPPRPGKNPQPPGSQHS